MRDMRKCRFRLIRPEASLVDTLGYKDKERAMQTQLSEKRNVTVLRISQTMSLCHRGLSRKIL